MEERRVKIKLKLNLICNKRTEGKLKKINKSQKTFAKRVIHKDREKQFQYLSQVYRKKIMSKQQKQQQLMQIIIAGKA